MTVYTYLVLMHLYMLEISWEISLHECAYILLDVLIIKFTTWAFFEIIKWISDEYKSCRYTFFLRGAGGFSKPGAETYSYDNRSPTVMQSMKLPILPQKHTSVISHEDLIHENQVQRDFAGLGSFYHIWLKILFFVFSL
jgi:hypothetical protein